MSTPAVNMGAASVALNHVPAVWTLLCLSLLRPCNKLLLLLSHFSVRANKIFVVFLVPLLLTLKTVVFGAYRTAEFIVS